MNPSRSFAQFNYGLIGKSESYFFMESPLDTSPDPLQPSNDDVVGLAVPG